MPELPEVETSCRGIRPHITQQVIKKIIVRQPQLRWPVPVDDLQALEGTTLLAVNRRGKYIKLEFAHAYVMIHLGMSGNLRIVSENEVIVKHDHLDFVFESGVILRLNDARRFGSCLYQSGNKLHSLLAKLGPEPLSADFDVKYLFERSRGKKQAIKNFIMDSHVVVGVGNIYAAEALFRAGINPKRAAGNISKKRYAVLVDAIKTVLAAAIEQGGTSLKDFVGGDGKPGYFKQALNVYGRDGQSCLQCSDTIKKTVQGQRSTFYCSSCQN